MSVEVGWRCRYVIMGFVNLTGWAGLAGITTEVRDGQEL